MKFDKLAEAITHYPDKKKLSEKTNIDETLLKKISNGETSLILNSVEIKKASHFLGVNEKPLVLPKYLRRSITEFEEGKKNNVSYLDCLWMDLYASINMAQINDNVITKEEADFLRNKYLWQNTNKIE